MPHHPDCPPGHGLPPGPHPAPGGADRRDGLGIAPGGAACQGGPVRAPVRAARRVRLGIRRRGLGRPGRAGRGADRPTVLGGRRARSRRGDRDRGQVALEYIGFIPILLFVALCGIQLGWVAYVHEQADTAARTAARAEARKKGAGTAAGRAAVRSGLAADVSVATGRDAVTATVSIPIKSIVPGLSIDPARATAIMPNDDPEVTGP